MIAFTYQILVSPLAQNGYLYAEKIHTVQSMEKLKECIWCCYDQIINLSVNGTVHMTVVRPAMKQGAKTSWAVKKSKATKFNARQ